MEGVELKVKVEKEEEGVLEKSMDKVYSNSEVMKVGRKIW